MLNIIAPRLHNDIKLAMDNQKVVLLLLFDLSAAFDTVDHNILLSRLETRFGVQGTALQWFQSYLTGRLQAVTVQGSRSSSNYSMVYLRAQSLGPYCSVAIRQPLGTFLGHMV